MRKRTTATATRWPSSTVCWPRSPSEPWAKTSSRSPSSCLGSKELPSTWCCAARFPRITSTSSTARGETRKRVRVRTRTARATEPHWFPVIESFMYLVSRWNLIEWCLNVPVNLYCHELKCHFCKASDMFRYFSWTWDWMWLKARSHREQHHHQLPHQCTRSFCLF